MKAVFWLTICVFASNFSSTLKAGSIDECSGCHTEQRLKSERKIEKFNINIWNDQKCFGCHSELVDIAVNSELKGLKDKRLLALPLRKETIAKIANTGMPYLEAKKGLDFEKYDINELILYLRQPSNSKNLWGMPAFPNLEASDLKLLKGSGVNVGSPESGSKIYLEKCATCHDQNQYPPAKLAIFRDSWIFDWANDSSLTALQKAGRTMPKVQLTSTESKNLSAFFRNKASQVRDNADSLISKELDSRFKNEDSNSISIELATKYVWQNFFRDGRCVHCHTGEQRASRHLEATPIGLKNYLRQYSGKKIWEAIERRAIEHTAGGSSKKPGMPMSGPPLPIEVRNVVQKWVKAGCPDESKNILCERK